MEQIKFTVQGNDSEKRMDQVISLHFDISRSNLKNRIEKESIKVNGRKRNLSFKVKNGDELEFLLSEQKEYDFSPSPMDLEIIYEDSSILAINKEPGVVVHPGGGVYSGTLINGVLHYLNGILPGESSRPGLVHRLDKDTSGVILFAKNAKSLEGLQKQFSERLVQKEYIALVVGRLKEDYQEVDAPIGRDPLNRKKMTVGGIKEKPSQTQIIQIDNYDLFSKVKALPKTGRTHQIRVHLAYLKKMIVGDHLYGTGKMWEKALGKVDRHMLHAQKIRFIHPEKNEELILEAKIPSDMETLENKIRELFSRR